jgi:hypothetical protein
MSGQTRTGNQVAINPRNVRYQQAPFTALGGRNVPIAANNVNFRFPEADITPSACGEDRSPAMAG